MHAIVITFDRFHLGYLGPYGNDWIETPQLNRLAMDAVVFDQCLGEARSPEDPRHGWWQQGRWLDALRERGVRTVLVTDTPLAPQLATAFGTTLEVSGQDGPDHPEVESTVARLMTKAGQEAEKLGREPRPSLLWIRSRGIPRPWLPPKEFVDLYFDEFRLTPLSEEDEEDLEVLHHSGRESDLPYIRAMYAACASCLDRWLTKVMKPLSQFASPPLVLLTAAAGEELGEHGEPGANDDDPYSPNLHVPLIIQWPSGGEGRRAALATCADVPATLCEWFSSPAPESGHSLRSVMQEEADAVREELAIVTDEHLALRTDSAYYVRRRAGTPSELHESAELFDKPSDRWDLANQAMLSPGLADELESRLLRHCEAQPAPPS